MGAQIISLQAGYTFATTIDPTSGADSAVLLTIAQLTAGFLFFATGLDRQILLAFAQSLSTHPPGHLAIPRPWSTRLIQTGSSIFSTGLRLVLPLLALLLMVEISLALLARLNSQLHIMTARVSDQDAAVAGAVRLAAPDLSRKFSRNPRDRRCNWFGRSSRPKFSVTDGGFKQNRKTDRQAP